MSANDYRAEERAARDEAEKATAEACKAIEATESGDAAAIAEQAETEAAKETERTAAEAAAALLDAYRRAFCGETSEEQEQAAYHVAAAELIPEGQRPAGYEAASEADRAAVAAMVDRIAQRNRR